MDKLWLPPLGFKMPTERDTEIAGVACPQCYLPVGSLTEELDGFCKCENREELMRDINPMDIYKILGLTDDGWESRFQPSIEVEQ